MTDKQRFFCVREMDAYTDRDAYIRDLALSSMWGDADDADVSQERIDELGSLWDICHSSVKDMAAAHGMSCRALAERFCIPYRTVENWSAGAASPAPYILLMMDELLGRDAGR